MPFPQSTSIMGRRVVLGGGAAMIGLLFTGPVAQASTAGAAIEVTPTGDTMWIATAIFGFAS